MSASILDAFKDFLIVVEGAFDARCAIQGTGSISYSAATVSSMSARTVVDTASKT